MFFATHPRIAKLAARVFQRIAPIALAKAAPAVRFAEVAARSEDLVAPTRLGPAPVRAYYPPDDGGSPAVYVNFHGGAFIVGHPDQDDPWCRYLAAAAGVVVLNVDYVLAPQHPFPAAAHQAFDVLRWAAEAGVEHGWDGARLAVGGQSAGASLAAAAARQVSEAGAPPLALQVLNYGPFDLAGDPVHKHRPVPKPMLPIPVIDLCMGAYLPHPSQRRHHLASPVFSDPEELRGIASALVVTAEHDRLRAESETYAQLLDRAGALQELVIVPGADHAYNLVAKDGRQTREMYDAISARVRHSLKA
ncbi:alpha/beta hydrolase [Geodermatophilus sabuli]|uniref:Alpha/beta hydrolase n=1 Tax=Geodermatophilus sabuli TaxID=1564158 RepID=A0A7K3VXH7_9ACTN|nr:alpha/beta hydrolase [Geodermatophilus sabuli]NEK56783.1 alpha/beta hydrolase [Geodermatophilus sabuli]